MKRCTLTIIIALVVLSTWACSPIGIGGEPAAAATSPPGESNRDEPGLAPGQIPQGRPGEDPGTMPLPPSADSNVEHPGFFFGQIPEGYPEREIPIYKPEASDILGALRQDMGDALFYNLVLGSNDDEQTVIQAIRNTFEKTSTEFEELLGAGMFYGLKDGWEYAIIVHSGEADGYETVVTYTLSKDK